MATPNKVIREYHSDASFQERFNIYNDSTEYQLCLAFATDSNNEGRFTAEWDTQKITPQVIQQFKTSCDAAGMPLTVFVSIGGKDPFKVAGDSEAWISNAKSSLKQIMSKYYITGLDVNYTTIESTQFVFVNCIQNLIKKLKEESSDFVASLAPSAATNSGFYLPLYQAIDTWIGTVVLQCVDIGFEPLHTKNPVQSLVHQVEMVADQYNDNDPKVLLGYSAIMEDWKIVSPSLFFLALNRLVQLPARFKGASVKVISDAKPSISATKWTPQFLCLAVDDAGPLP